MSRAGIEGGCKAERGCTHRSTASATCAAISTCAVRVLDREEARDLPRDDVRSSARRGRRLHPSRDNRHCTRPPPPGGPEHRSPKNLRIRLISIRGVIGTSRLSVGTIHLAALCSQRGGVWPPKVTIHADCTSRTSCMLHLFVRTPARPQYTSASVMSLTHTAVSALHDHAVALTHMCPDLYGIAVCI